MWNNSQSYRGKLTSYNGLSFFPILMTSQTAVDNPQISVVLFSDAMGNKALTSHDSSHSRLKLATPNLSITSFEFLIDCVPLVALNFWHSSTNHFAMLYAGEFESAMISLISSPNLCSFGWQRDFAFGPGLGYQTLKSIVLEPFLFILLVLVMDNF